MVSGFSPTAPSTSARDFWVPRLAAAAAIALMVGLTWRNASPAPSWEVAVIVGTPRVGAGALVGEGRITVGQTLTTDAGSRAKMQVGDIGEVTVDEGTRVRLVETRSGHHRLALERGTLHAAITAPPGQFIVNTPSATATDLGCIYSLHVDDDGSGMLSVEAGWVAFEEHGRESFVPMGASSRTDRVNGPGTPRYDDTEQAFRDAVDEVDNGTRLGAQGGGAAVHPRPRARPRCDDAVASDPARRHRGSRGGRRCASDARADAGVRVARRDPAPRPRRARSVVGQARARRGELVEKVEG